ncbi:putative C4-dicarboxylate transporter family protein, DctM subunit [Lentisphaera araneosa HTCC2155]|uniref:Putative C4-dicarboxylate transporter family protein, DctM subunit n=1 Tax=Lentisphaera araneosa HTCC2155 TaxID=313628 RepID=A6DRT5_9BACT|nr:TRAP transporter large permease subunit [Lentisphaera araneosa]EDM25620.1 putative C4-dicarboxylate transporter family protein, DctM subunit [Lentisphaera araneosa HTCC2155]
MYPEELMLIAMFGILLLFIFIGVRIAFAIAGTGMLTTVLCLICNKYFETNFFADFNNLGLLVNRVYSLMSSSLLVALPMFVFMGIMLEKSGLAENLMESFQKIFSSVRGGLALAVTLIGLLLAASTGIIGASVVLLALMSIPTMLKNGYSKELACGTVCSAGCLGILIPPSIMLILLADQMGVSVGDLFHAAVLPGLLLTASYCVYIFFKAQKVDKSEVVPLQKGDLKKLFLAIIPPMLLMFLVLGSIFFGIATPTEASGLGAFGAMILAFSSKKLDYKTLRLSVMETGKTTSFIMAILIGAACFSLTLKELEGDEIIRENIMALPFGHTGIILAILAMIFLLGFFLDWIEITLVMIPIVAPIISAMALEMPGQGLEQAELIWFAILVAVTLQTSFLTPPVGFALFYLKGVTPKEIELKHIYKGVIPFIILQVLILILIFLFPSVVLWLPSLAA